MNKLFAMLSDGAFSIADAYVSPREYVKLPRNGFRQDNASLRADVKRVGGTMGMVIERNGKSHKRSGNK